MFILSTLELQLLCFIFFMLLLCLLIWHCNKELLIKVYEQPHVFFLNRDISGGISPREASLGLASSSTAVRPGPKSFKSS